MRDDTGDDRVGGRGFLPRRPGEYASAGKTANLDQLASVTLSRVVGGDADGYRALDMRAAGGIDLRILPDRGFDLRPAWFRGVPLAWISAVGERAPWDSPNGGAWIEAFAGGLVTTCGLRNVGAPSGGARTARPVLAHPGIRRSDGARIRGPRRGPHRVGDDRRGGGAERALRVERTVRTRTGTGLVMLTDVRTNLGVGIEPAPLLYHVNVGVPLVDEGARIEIHSQEVLPRDADAERGRDYWMAPGQSEPGVLEMVFEHRIRPIPPIGPRPRSSTPRSASRSTCCGDTPSSPGSTSGSIPVEGSTWWGLEAANCSVLGLAADRAAGVLPVLERQEARTTELRILVRALPGAA